MGKTASKKRSIASASSDSTEDGSASGALSEAATTGEPAEPLERARLQAEVARQRVRIAKEELKRARKWVKEAKREAKRARRQADAARKTWKKVRKAHRGSPAAGAAREGKASETSAAAARGRRGKGRGSAHGRARTTGKARNSRTDGNIGVIHSSET
ncbi:MAG TPA: hypothetical protein VFN79_13200 [Steroidobacteraceae bacterium]|nr:hypothetical protein [Steroidobacteraceae bacterium]